MSWWCAGVLHYLVHTKSGSFKLACFLFVKKNMNQKKKSTWNSKRFDPFGKLAKSNGCWLDGINRSVRVECRRKRAHLIEPINLLKTIGSLGRSCWHSTAFLLLSYLPWKIVFDFIRKSMRECVFFVRFFSSSLISFRCFCFSAHMLPLVYWLSCIPWSQWMWKVNKGYFPCRLQLTWLLISFSQYMFA